MDLPKRHDSVHSLPIDNDAIDRRKQPFKPSRKLNDFPAELVRREHHGAQVPVEPGTIATAGQHTDARLNFRKSESEEFLRISHPPGSRPLIV